MYLSTLCPGVSDIFSPLNEDPKNNRYVQWLVCQELVRPPVVERIEYKAFVVVLSSIYPQALLRHFSHATIQDKREQTMIRIKIRCRYQSTHTKERSSSSVLQSLGSSSDLQQLFIFGSK
jgi:hypothetical protein